MLLRRLVWTPLIAGLLLASFNFFSSTAARAAQPRALLELFTSQGCSSCPPADKLLGELSADPSLVALSVPIDYWDYLGWKDTLATPADSARQRAYSRARGDRQVYTPQIVVNGSTHVLGSDRAALDRAIVQTDQKSGVMSLPIRLSIGGAGSSAQSLSSQSLNVQSLNVQVESAENEHVAAEVWLCPLAKAVQVEIGRGENHGRTVTYHNVVRGWIKLGDWAGAKSTWQVPLSQIAADGVDAAAVMVQEGNSDKPGIVLGAAYLPLK